MKKEKHAESFERILLSYAEMCYSVALTLTNDSEQAQDLARGVLTQAWQVCDHGESRKNIKKKLLKELRKQFLQDYGPVLCSRKNEVSCF